MQARRPPPKRAELCSKPLDQLKASRLEIYNVLSGAVSLHPVRNPTRQLWPRVRVRSIPLIISCLTQTLGAQPVVATVRKGIHKQLRRSRPAINFAGPPRRAATAFLEIAKTGRVAATSQRRSWCSGQAHAIRSARYLGTQSFGARTATPRATWRLRARVARTQR